MHRPSPANPPCTPNSTNPAGDAITETPPASARSHSPPRNDWHARCNATSDDEHAVSTVTAGPSVPKTYASRPDATLADTPVSPSPSTASPAFANSHP